MEVSRIPSREELELSDIFAELGWDRLKIHEERELARKHLIPFIEWVRSLLAIHKRLQSGPEYDVEVEWEAVPCALIFTKLENSHLRAASTLLDRLSAAFPDHPEQACRWLRTVNQELSGKTPADLVFSDRFEAVIRALNSH